MTGVIAQDLDRSASPYGVRAVIAENEHLRFVLFPDLGAKIYSIVHKPTGKELLWRNSTALAEHEPGSSFDDTWAGGWDELFPNDEPAALNGDVYPDHGELWTSKWTCDVSTDKESGTIYVATECPQSRTRMEKWITMEGDQERIRFHHRLTNLRNRPLRYLWKLHPAFAIGPGDRVLIPAARIRLEPEFLGTLGGGAMEWSNSLVSIGERDIDLTVVPPAESKEVHFYYGLDLKAGWCACYDSHRQLACGLAFPKDLFTSCWLFASYGGWRGHYVAALEPSTAYPFRIEEAVESATLPAGGQQEADVVFSVRQGISTVNHISADGAIT